MPGLWVKVLAPGMQREECGQKPDLCFFYRQKIHFSKTYDKRLVLLWRVTLGKPYKACGFFFLSELSYGKLPPKVTDSKQKPWAEGGRCVLGVGDGLFTAPCAPKRELRKEGGIKKGSGVAVITRNCNSLHFQ